MVYQLSLRDAPKDTSGLTFSFDDQNSELSIKLNGNSISSENHQVIVIFSDEQGPLDDQISLSEFSYTEEAFENLIINEAQNIGNFISLKFAVYEAGADLSTAQAVATSDALTDFEAAKTLATAPSTPYTIDEARNKVASAFGVTEPQETFFHYNPIAANDVQGRH